MFRKTIAAAATAGMLAIGSLAVMPTTASAASGGVQFGGPGWNVQIGNFGPGFHQGRHCRPVVKTVKYWKWGRPHWRQVVVGYDCGRRHGGPWQGPGHGPGFPGGGPGFPGGPGHGGPGGGWGNW